MQKQLEFIDVYGVWYKPWWQTTFFYILIGTFFSSLFLYVIVRYLRKEKKLTPQQQALQDLSRLNAINYSDQKAMHEAYFKMTSIIKNYFILVYGLKLHDKNDKEIIEQLDGIIPKNMIELLKEFFDRSFHIKFAYEVVSESTLRQDIEMLHDFILELGRQQTDSLGKS